MKRLVPHPLAELIPPMSKAEYAALKADIAANGLREPIDIYEGKILDGRNRYLACIELGLKVATRPFAGTAKKDAAIFVFSKSNRRNLDRSQRACVALGFLNRLSLPAAGAAMHVNRDYVSKAKFVRDTDRDIYRRVFEGKIRLYTAYAMLKGKVARKPPRDDGAFHLTIEPTKRIRIYVNKKIVFEQNWSTRAAKGAK